MDPSRRAARRAARSEREHDAEIAARVSPTGRVLAGPFEGLKIAAPTMWNAPALYLSGCYEHELVDAIAASIARKPSCVVDIGSADGYYAVGYALRLPDVEVHAFDLDPAAQRATARIGKLNGVANLRVHGRVTPSVLDQTLTPGALVFCDCEGFEGDLLDPVTAPGLRNAQIIVELHDVLRPGVSSDVTSRFEATHTTVIIPQQPLAPDATTHLAHLEASDRVAATDEARPGPADAISWAFMTPKAEG